MSNRTYEDYIKNDCHPVGYNEPCQSYYFAQSSVDLLLNKIDLLKQQLEESFTEEDVEGLIEDRDKTIKFLQKELAEKDKEIERYKQELEQTNAGYDFIYEQSGETINELKQLAIQKLEKVKEYNSHLIYGSNLVNKFIDQQIKELKGE